MKELEKTKRISISAVLFLLIVVIAILTFEKPQHVFEKNTHATLNEIVNNNYILTLHHLDSLKPSQYELIDIRSNFEYSKGHIKNAINISTHQLLKNDNIEYFNELKENNKNAILYGKDPDEANSAWMVLYQLGYENVKILCVETNYTDNEFRVKNYALEKASVNYAEIIEKSKGTSIEAKKVVVKPKAPKRIITKPKKKKRVPEGGC